MFSNPFPNAFGLDIGDLSIKLVQLKNTSFRHRHPAYRISNARSIALPPGLIVNGELQQPEQVRHYIQKLLIGAQDLKEKRIKTPWVVASLPETQGFIKLIRVSKPPAEIIEDDIILEAEKHIPFIEGDGYYMDWQTLSEEEEVDHTAVLVGAIPKPIADSYTYLLESVGLGVKALEIEALSIARSMITASKEYGNEARALLDLGAVRSSLIIYDKDRLQLSMSLPFSGELISTAISQKLNISLEEAEKIKRKNGLHPSQSKEGKKIWSTVIGLTDGLVEDIKKNFHFYYSHFPKPNKITRITLCGGGANLKNLDRLLAARLKVVCGAGNPWKNLDCAKHIKISEEYSLDYTTAIGLAVRAADNPFFTADII